MAWRYSLRNSPNAPEITRLPPRRFQPSRPNRNARRYSTTWMPGRKRRGTRASATRPSLTVQLLATRTVPPTAAILRPSRNGRVSRSRASGSINVSAATAITRGKRLALIAALSESALQPFSLSIANIGAHEDGVRPEGVSLDQTLEVLVLGEPALRPYLRDREAE